MKGLQLMALCAACGWAADFPIDTTIRIAYSGYPDDEIKVPVSQLDTDLVFFTSLGTASCPGYASGDIKGMEKKPRSAHPNPGQNVPLWSITMYCGGTQPNTYTVHPDYYEYGFRYRGKTLYLDFTQFIGPASFPVGTQPPLEFRIRIDTVPGWVPSSLRKGTVTALAKGAPAAGVDALGRKAAGRAIPRL